MAFALLSASPTQVAAQSVDPQPSWSVEGGQSGAAAGTLVANAGDIDGDGFDDVLVGAPGYDGAATDGGVAWLFTGGPAGLGASPSWTYADTLGGGASIQALAGVGDVNSDGFADIAVGVPDASSAGGRVLVFTGAASGLGVAPFATLTGGAMAQFGASLSGAGDMGDDGFDDLLVGGWADGAGPGDGGARGGVRLFAGSTGGLVQVWSATGPDLDDAFGWSVAGGGDVDGDGHLDVVVGGTGHADDRGGLWFFPGDGVTAATTALWTQVAAAPGELLGTALGPLVDLSGDGRADIFAASVGDPSGATPMAGRVDLWFGDSPQPSAAASWSSTGLAASDTWGRGLSAGDIDGDGARELLIGVPGAGDGGVHLFAGAPGGPTSTAAQILLPSSGTVAGFGRALALADVNGDSLLDLVVGAPLSSNGEEDEGAAFLYLGVLADADGDGDLDGTDCDDLDATVFNGARSAATAPTRTATTRRTTDSPISTATARRTVSTTTPTATSSCRPSTATTSMPMPALAGRSAAPNLGTKTATVMPTPPTPIAPATTMTTARTTIPRGTTPPLTPTAPGVHPASSCPATATTRRGSSSWCRSPTEGAPDCRDGPGRCLSLFG